MKRTILAILLSVLMLFSVTACDVNEALELADELLDLAEELSSQTDVTQTEEAETAQDPVDMQAPAPEISAPEYEEPVETVLEDGVYTSKEDVSRYLYLYGHLPGNYVTKQQARDAGWDNSAGNLWDVLPGKSIGGDRFGNYEKQLPDAEGRKWFECDIDYDGGYRDAKRIVYSNDGLIYYTEDHYETFEQLY